MQPGVDYARRSRLRASQYFDERRAVEGPPCPLGANLPSNGPKVADLDLIASDQLFVRALICTADVQQTRIGHAEDRL